MNWGWFMGQLSHILEGKRERDRREQPASVSDRVVHMAGQRLGEVSQSLNMVVSAVNELKKDKSGFDKVERALNSHSQAITGALTDVLGKLDDRLGQLDEAIASLPAEFPSMPDVIAASSQSRAKPDGCIGWRYGNAVNHWNN